MRIFTRKYAHMHTYTVIPMDHTLSFSYARARRARTHAHSPKRANQHRRQGPRTPLHRHFVEVAEHRLMHHSLAHGYRLGFSIPCVQQDSVQDKAQWCATCPCMPMST